MEGKTIVFTGTLKIKRAEASKMATEAGATVASGVTGKTHILVAGTEAGSKIAAARSKGVAIWSEADFMAALQNTGKSRKRSSDPSDDSSPAAKRPDPADKILNHEDVSGLVFDKLSLADLLKLADAKPALLPKIKALEARWMRGCIELCGGTLDWLDNAEKILEQCDNSWMEAWQTLEAARTEWLNVSVPSFNGGLCLPETLPWGDEKWSRLQDPPLQDAYARAALYFPSLQSGCVDYQCDAFPVGVAFYRRTAQAASDGPLGSAEAREENIVKLRRAFYPNCCEDFAPPEAHVLEPISVAALLANLPSPMKAVKDNWDPDGDVVRGLPSRYIERAIWDAAARSATFVALCVGEERTLSPGVALEVLQQTKLRIVNACDDEIFLEEMAMGEKGVYDDDPSVGHDDEWEEITTLAPGHRHG